MAYGFCADGKFKPEILVDTFGQHSMEIRTALIVSSASLVPGLCCLPQSQAAEKSDTKVFETAVSLAQFSTQWSYLIIRGSVLILLLGTSYYRPVNLKIRACRAYLAYRLVREPNFAAFKETINRDAYTQISFMRRGLGFFGLWLLVYALWWIFTEKICGHSQPTRRGSI